MQIFVKNNNQWQGRPISKREVDLFKKALKTFQIVLPFAHTGYLINLASPEHVVFSRSFKSMKDELKRCHRLNLPCLVVHPGSTRSDSEVIGIKRVIKALKDLIRQTPRYKTRILLETTAGQGTSLGWRFEQIAAILNEIESRNRIGVCLDTCHVFAAGYDITTPKGYDKTFDSFEKLIGFKQLFAVHLNDSKKPLGSRVDRHEHIGKGYMGTKVFSRIMNDPRFASIPKVIETPKGKDDTDDICNLNLLKSFVRCSHAYRHSEFISEQLF